MKNKIQKQYCMSKWEFRVENKTMLMIGLEKKRTREIYYVFLLNFLESFWSDVIILCYLDVCLLFLRNISLYISKISKSQSPLCAIGLGSIYEVREKILQCCMQAYFVSQESLILINNMHHFKVFSLAYACFWLTLVPAPRIIL